MSWINISRNKSDFIKQVEQSLIKWEGVNDVLGTYKLGIKALITGTHELINPTLELCEKWMIGYLPRDDKFSEEYMDFPTVLNFSLLSHINGNNQEVFWGKLLQVNCNNKTSKILQQLLKHFVQNSYAGEYSKPGHVIDEKDWHNILKKGNIDYLWNLVSCPDHPLWKRSLSVFFLPILLIYHSSLNKKGQSCSLVDLASNNMVEISGKIMYERITLEEKVFDAVCLSNGHLYTYYFLGFRWKLPLIFPSAFTILEELESAWENCKKKLPKKSIEEINQLLLLGKCTHIILHDSTYAMPVEKETQKAEKQYHNLNFRLEDIISIKK